MNRQEKLDAVYQRAFDYERDKGGCSQCVMAALKDELGVGNDAVFRAGDALAGGTALSGNGTCGALSGAIMAISAEFGRDRGHFEAYRDFGTFELAKSVYDQFVAQYGGCLCKEVQTTNMGRSFNLWDPADREAFDAAGGHEEKCPDVVGKTARWAAAAILTNGDGV